MHYDARRNTQDPRPFLASVHSVNLGPYYSVGEGSHHSVTIYNYNLICNAYDTMEIPVSTSSAQHNNVPARISNT